MRKLGCHNLHPSVNYEDDLLSAPMPKYGGRGNKS